MCLFNLLLTYTLSTFLRDRGSSDDCIGTAFINLSSIVGRGESDEGLSYLELNLILYLAPIYLSSLTRCHGASTCRVQIFL